MATALEIIQATLKNMNDDFKHRFEQNHISLDNISQIGDFITSEDNMKNAFMEVLLNKVGISKVMSKLYHNPLAKLKSNTGVPYGSTIEELYVNPATDLGYQKEGTKLLETVTPTGFKAYYGMNRKGFYKHSIQKDSLTQAFHDERSFMKFFDGIVTAIYSGDNVDEFDLTRKMLGKNLDDNHIHKVEVDAFANPKELAKAIINISKQFTYNTMDYNGYNLVNADSPSKVKTFCPTENQVLLIRSDVSTEIDYEVLADTFNISKRELKLMTIEVNDFMSDKFDCHAILCDKEAIQVIDKVFETSVFYNDNNRYWDYKLHHWQFLYLSMFCNCVAFGKTKPTA